MADYEQNLNNEQKIYVWTKSEKAGTIVYEWGEKDGWLYFTDGSRINPNLLSEFLMEAGSDEEASDIANDILGTPKESKINNNQTQHNQKSDQPSNQPADKNKRNSNPSIEDLSEEERNRIIAMEMISQVSRKNVDNIPINVHLPNVDIFNMLTDQMDKDPEELKSLITDLILKQIDEQREALKEQIFNYLQEYYSQSKNEIKLTQTQPEKSFYD
jgi:hypothetical protein